MKVAGLAVQTAATKTSSIVNVPIIGGTSRITIVGGDVLLPAPRDGNQYYSKSEAADILFSAGGSGTRNRSRVKKEMIKSGRVPATADRILRSIMQLRDAGKPIEDTPWNERKKPVAKSGGGCGGIQNRKLNAVAGSNYQYLIDTLQYHLDGDGNWHAKGCSDENVNKSGRCKKCDIANKNMSRYIAMMSGSTIPLARPTSPTSVIEGEDDIGTRVEERLKAIAEVDFATDPRLQELAYIMDFRGMSGVEIYDGSQMFMVCRDCKDIRLCQKRGNNSDTCAACCRKRGCKEWQKERREANFDQRTDPQSKTNWTLRWE